MKPAACPAVLVAIMFRCWTPGGLVGGPSKQTYKKRDCPQACAWPRSGCLLAIMGPEQGEQCACARVCVCARVRARTHACCHFAILVPFWGAVRAAFCGWGVQPVADIRASVTFLFGMFVSVKRFIIFL